mgnify:CR=1 FL=1
MGIIFTKRLNVTEEVHTRLVSANKCVIMMSNMLRPKIISRAVRYKTVIRPIVIYESKTWTMGKVKKHMAMGIEQDRAALKNRRRKKKKRKNETEMEERSS